MTDKHFGKKRIVNIIAAALAAAGIAVSCLTSDTFSMAALKCLLIPALIVPAVSVYHRGFRNSLKKYRENRAHLRPVVLFTAGLLIYLILYIINERGIIEAGGRTSLLTGFLIILTIPVCACLFLRQKPLSRIYLLLGSVFGILFLLLSVPGRIPDEHVHIAGAYYISDLMCGQAPETGDFVNMRAEDAVVLDKNTEDIHTDGGTSLLIPYWESLIDGQMTDEETLVPSAYKRPDTAPYQYFLPSLGITAGRFLHLNAARTFFLGRLFSLLLSVLLTALAIRLAPVGKEIFLVLALTPMYLQQASSFSYDAFVNASAFALTALALYLLLKEQLTAKEILLGTGGAVVLSFLLLPVKGYALFGLSILPLIVVFRTAKREGGSADRPVRILRICMILLCCGIFLLFAGIRIWPMISGSTGMGHGTSNYLNSLGERGYVFSDFIKDPKLILFYANATLHELGYYLETMLGRRLGWMSVYLDNTLIYAYFALLILASLPKEGEMRLPRPARLILFTGSVLTALSTLAGMLLNWTPFGSQTIQGMQGRYFLCLMPAFLLSIRGQKMRQPAGSACCLTYVLIGLAFFTVEFLLRF